MDLRLYLERAENELSLAKVIFTLTNNEKIQIEVFEIEKPLTFYSAVISHAYYCIFYSAKAYLLKKGIKVEAPEEHRKTYEAFKKFVSEGILDIELLRIYEEVRFRAEKLLGILKKEKKKRGDFTYQIIPQANREPAEESLNRAREFFRNMYNLCE